METAPIRPAPDAGQVWSAAAPKNANGRRYVAVVDVDPSGSFADVVEVSKGGHPVRENMSKGTSFRTTLSPVHEMSVAYRYEPSITAVEIETPDEGTSSASGRKENTVSTNPAETVPTKATKPKTAKKPRAAKKGAEKAEHFTDERIAAFMTSQLKKDPETTRSAAIKAFREAGHPCGEIRLRTLFDVALKGFKKAAKDAK